VPPISYSLLYLGIVHNRSEFEIKCVVFPIRERSYKRGGRRVDHESSLAIYRNENSPVQCEDPKRKGDGDYHPA